MVTILTPWAKRATVPDKRVRLNQNNPLSQGLVLAWSGHHGLDVVSGIRPTLTGVTPSTAQYGRAWSFAGGAEGVSDINFGTYSATANLHQSPATWAFLIFNAGAISQTALACHCDANVDRGFSIGWHSDGSGFGLGAVLIRSSTNIRRRLTVQPADFTQYSLVVTYDGGSASSGLNLWLNGALGSMATGTNASGTTGAATSESLYLGRRRFDTTLSNNNTIALALIANRTWTEAEVSSFHQNPWQVFEESRSHVTFSFSGFLPPQVDIDVFTYLRESLFLD